ncbi:MAG: Cobyrinic acid a,c-diamide synthase (CbiA) [Leptospirillum sp. Group II 'C75']|jgi:cobyrinic acid a,c-diamide synthase|uniref:Cobyrinate a,c-diamide synthase n=1 Tax=Leptospirillum ferriphilum YSK TaxID=1441628 RepID=A0A059XYS8_9BACT|nr:MULTISPECIES: cobyrinate a,c-diamide synthase [Leptospirillum]AIA30461.1 cobyrinic acid a,c-diamide synthase [Leptospirillum ferriphilum YSK]EAY56202.1 MAG: Cobyrinic acid a,c-diamide synthase (CbiA) [Leptospirillum rubarum]EIJ75306.1 MAG: Cobyrinic acid a,c-diamide synthase (CbiA) [Leptospirillum sp. Group II 'C75']
MKNRRPGVVVAGLHSGSGKTLVTLALLQGLQKRGYVVRPFKCGPDFIDPRFHEWISGRTSVNLDPFFLSSGDIQALYDRMTEGLSGGVAEGVMGFYDGLAKKTSTYDLARILDLPVLLAVHSKGIAETLASVVKGVRDHRPDSRLAGIIAVQTGSPKHGEILSRALEEEGLPPLLGTLPRDENLKLPERHLGLVDVRELERSGQLGSLSQQLEHFSSNWHWEKIGIFFDRPSRESLSGRSDSPDSLVPGTKRSGNQKKLRLGVAWDSAFRFYYPENWSALESRGIEIVSFSPLQDPVLPEELDGIYLGGGYPEHFLEELSQNISFLESVRSFHASGRFIYAECGGMLYLTDGPLENEKIRWAGLFPYRFRMNGHLRRLGYVSAVPVGEEGWFSGSSSIRGHFFHYSELVPKNPAPEVSPGFLVDGRPEGFRSGPALASYMHLYFPSSPRFLEEFADQLENNHSHMRKSSLF